LKHLLMPTLSLRINTTMEESGTHFKDMQKTLQ
jgi:hypothetical protein